MLGLGTATMFCRSLFKSLNQRFADIANDQIGHGSSLLPVRLPIQPRQSVFPRAAEPVLAARARREIIDHFEATLHHGHDYELRDALQRVDREAVAPAVPAGDHQLTLIVR